MTQPRPVDPHDEAADRSEWHRLVSMLDEAGRESFPASDVPAIDVDGPVNPSDERDGAEGSEASHAIR
jgi:hypothetical protein